MTPPCPRRRSSDLVDGRLVACGRGGGAFGLRFLRGERRGEGADAGENQHGAAALTGPAGFGHIHCITPHILSLSDQSASVSIGAAASGAGSPRSARCSASRSSAFSHRSAEHTSELPSLMRISYAVFCLKKKNLLRTKNVSLRQSI